MLSRSPTKLCLKARGIDVDEKCDICGNAESSGHALWSYKIAEVVWSCTRLKLPYFQEPPMDFIDIMWGIKERGIGFNWELFAITVWCLWNNRNQVRHRGQGKNNEVIVREATNYMKESQPVIQTQETLPTPDTTMWSPPKPGWYKVNTDGAIFDEMRS